MKPTMTFTRIKKGISQFRHKFVKITHTN